MVNQKLTTPILLLWATSCSPPASQPPANALSNDVVSPTVASNEGNAVVEEAPLNPPAPGEPGGLPDDRTPLTEGSIDSKSAQGAAQVLQRYFALLEAGKTAEARALWSGSDIPEDFANRLAGYGEVHANIGAPGDLGGAAGSIYVEVPVQLYGRLKNGKEFNALGTMTLRRVNDVPGSTDEQRRWHIYRADFPRASAST